MACFVVFLLLSITYKLIMNKKISKLWLAAVVLSSGLLASCNKDSVQEPNSSSQSGASVTLSLNLEASVENEAMRSLAFQTGVNTLNQYVPIPKFTDGQLVPVHTIIKGSNGAYGIKTLNWKYSSAKGRLILETRDSGNEFPISNFNNDAEWFVSGVIGGTLEGTKVKFDAPTRTLKGLTDGQIRSEGTDMGNLDIPYAFGWTKLSLHTLEGNSFKVADASPAVFQPRGAFIGYKLGNNQSNNYTFSATGFTVTSDAFGDKGSFDLNGTPTSGKLPVWTESDPISTMNYTLDIQPSSYPSDPNKVSDLTYYAWVMPTRAAESGTIVTASNRIMLKGQSSKYDADQSKDYTKTYFTDYLVPTATKGKVSHGRVHRMTARATERVALPIEYVTEYNLAGGGLIQSMTIAGLSNQQPEGIKGDLRFSNHLSNGSVNPNPHNNDQSGYYNWYELTGTQNSQYNPTSKSLQNEVNSKWPNRYFAPEIDHWIAVWSSVYHLWSSTDGSTNNEEAFQLGYGHQFYSYGQSNYSKVFTDDDPVFYGIRFEPTSRRTPKAISRFWKNDTNEPRIYLPLTDNTLRCAYRYSRVGVWDESTASLTSHLKIDVVYLGEATATLATISDGSWWTTKEGEGKVISRIYPAAGWYYTENILRDRGSRSVFWSTSAESPQHGLYPDVMKVHINAIYTTDKHRGTPVRLFKRNPDQ